MADLITGYYGFVPKPGSLSARPATLTHFKKPGERRPYCGVRISDEAIWQWCANRDHTAYLECKRCYLKWLKAQKEIRPHSVNWRLQGLLRKLQ